MAPTPVGRLPHWGATLDCAEHTIPSPCTAAFTLPARADMETRIPCHQHSLSLYVCVCLPRHRSQYRLHVPPRGKGFESELLHSVRVPSLFTRPSSNLFPDLLVQFPHQLLTPAHLFPLRRESRHFSSSKGFSATAFDDSWGRSLPSNASSSADDR